MFTSYRVIVVVVGLLFGQHSAHAMQPEAVMQQFAVELQKAKQTEFGVVHSGIIEYIERYIAHNDDKRLLSMLADLDIVYWNSQIITLNQFSQDTRTIIMLPSLALLLSAIANDIAVIGQLLESPCMQLTNIEKAIVLCAKYGAAEQAIKILLETGVHPYADNARALFILAHAKNVSILQLYLNAAVKYAIKMSVVQDLEMRMRAVQFTFSQNMYKEDCLDILALLQEKYNQLMAGNEPEVIAQDPAPLVVDDALATDSCMPSDETATAQNSVIIELQQETAKMPNSSKKCGCCTLL